MSQVGLRYTLRIFEYIQYTCLQRPRYLDFGFGYHLSQQMFKNAHYDAIICKNSSADNQYRGVLIGVECDNNSIFNFVLNLKNPITPL